MEKEKKRGMVKVDLHLPHKLYQKLQSAKEETGEPIGRLIRACVWKSLSQVIDQVESGYVPPSD